MSNVTEFKATKAAPAAFTPQSLEQAMQFCSMLSKSTLVPKDFQNNPGNIFVAIQWGAELGMQPMQAMQNIAVVNGRPSVWGDALIAIVRASPACEYIRESFEGEGDAIIAICKVKRRGNLEEERRFSVEDAKKAGLWGRNTWASYPKRMLQMRARGWALRDVFPDVLRGMAVAEEAMDMSEKDAGFGSTVVMPTAQIEHQPAQSVPTDLNAALKAKAESQASPVPAAAESQPAKVTHQQPAAPAAEPPPVGSSDPMDDIITIESVCAKLEKVQSSDEAADVMNECLGKLPKEEKKIAQDKFKQTLERLRVVRHGSAAATPAAPAAAKAPVESSPKDDMFDGPF